MRLLNFQKSPATRQWQQVYERTPGLAGRSFEEQRTAIREDMSQYAGAMERTMGPLGYDVVELYTDVEPLQRAWARENGVAWTLAWRKSVPLAQAQAYRPTIVWSYDSRNLDFAFLAEMRRQVPSITLVTGFIASPSYDIATFQQYDFLLTCTEEYAGIFRQAGIETYKTTHVFDREVLAHLDTSAPKESEAVFSGTIFRSHNAHLERERVLEAMVAVPGFELYCSTAERSPLGDMLETAARRGVYTAHRVMQRFGVSQSRRRSLPLIGPAATWSAAPMRQINPRLLPFMRPPRYGRAMYKLLGSAKVVVDCVGAREAANMRLFEATGVGSCLLTSWRPNLSTVFELDAEVVSYRSPEECAEKCRWLLDHPAERERIAASGQARTLRDYTYEHRAALLDDLIRTHLATSRRSSMQSRVGPI